MVPNPSLLPSPLLYNDLRPLLTYIIDFAALTKESNIFPLPYSSFLLTNTGDNREREKGFLEEEEEKMGKLFTYIRRSVRTSPSYYLSPHLILLSRFVHDAFATQNGTNEE